ncbi:hypothetical protein M885DRAFT_622628 [Pelagophyceae sp. CCMP2097]|nr:hypothetical protein M885DRAFT_622628 [Pelagophyceae sp. CCMP2097]
MAAAPAAFKAWTSRQYATAKADARASCKALSRRALVEEAVALKMAALRAQHDALRVADVASKAKVALQRSDNQVKNRMLSGERNSFKDDKITPFFSKACSSVVHLLGVAFLKITAACYGHQRRFGYLQIFFAALWGGVLLETMQHRVLKDARLDVYEIVKEQNNNPRSLNDRGVDAMRRAEGAPTGTATTVPSSSAISRGRKIVTGGCVEKFGIEASDCDLPGDAWRLGSPEKFLQGMLKAFGVLKIVQGAFIYTLQLAIDGAPMTNQHGLSRMLAIPCAAVWGQESYDTLRFAFKPIIDAFRELEAQGCVWVEGVLVPFAIVFGLDKKCEWMGTIGCGGAMGSATWPDAKTPVLAQLRHLGMPFGCGCGDPDCGHWRLDIQRVKDGAAATSQKLFDLLGWDCMNFVEPIVVNKAHAVEHACCVPVPAFGAEGVEDLVDGWDEQTVNAKWTAVRFRTLPVPCVAVMRSQLVEALTSIDLLRRADAYLQFKGPREGSLWGVDHEVVAEDGLHCILRMGGMVKGAFMTRLRSGGAEAERAILLAEKLIQRRVASYKVRYEPETHNTEIAVHEDGDKNARAILALFASEEQDEAAAGAGAPTGTGQAARSNPLTALILDPVERRRWWKMFDEYNEGIKIVRMVPTIIPGEGGYVEQLHADADKMQGHFDTWWVAARPFVGVTVLTNYGHSLKGGNFSRFMKRFGCLVCFSADAMEQKNDDMFALFFRHSQKFGSCGRGVGARKATMVETLWGSALRQMAYMTGKDKEILAAHAAAVRVRAAGAKIRHLLRVRFPYR